MREIVSAIEILKEKVKGCKGSNESCELSLSEVILLLHVFVLYHFFISNNIDSPMDIGGLSNHVKYCVSVLTLQ